MTQTARILLVDDEKDITEPLKVGLMRKGLVVSSFNDPREALEAFRRGEYDVAILDIRMPQMNGFELCRALTKIDEDIRIWFLTAFDIYREEFEKVFPNMKVQNFLKKPVRIADLVEHITGRTEKAKVKA